MTLTVDVGNLAVFHPTFAFTVPFSNTKGHAAEVADVARECAQELLRSIEVLPGNVTEDGKIVTCPPPVYRLPREKPLPKKSEFLTPWEKFANKKGIKLNQKKTNKVWDENLQEWRDKWGKRAREHEKKFEWASEIAPNYMPDAIGGDPFLDKKQRKKTALAKAGKNQARNEKKRDANDRGEVTGAKGMGSRDTEKVREVAETSRHLVTASMGKFDKVPKKRKI